jgi:hypothetical protein
MKLFLILILFILYTSCTIFKQHDISKLSVESEEKNSQYPDFRVTPYIQNPTSESISIIWFSHKNQPGEISYWSENKEIKNILSSSPQHAKSLYYSLVDLKDNPKSILPAPYKHRIRLTNLKRHLKFNYRVRQGQSEFSSSFSLPSIKKSFNFVVMADTETEPESIGKHAKWGNQDEKKRKYLIDQYLGLRNNLKVIQISNPDFIILAGDLVESGGEQRDWDEFWKHFAPLASNT